MRKTLSFPATPDRFAIRLDVISVSNGSVHIQKMVDHGTGDGYQLASHMSLHADTVEQLAHALASMAIKTS